MNVYSALWELLRPAETAAPAGVFGTLTAIAPPTVTVRGTAVSDGLLYPSGTAFRREDLGREAALLPCEEGLWFLGFREGGA